MIKVLLLILAIVCLVMIPFMPQLVRFRIRFMRRLGWQWAGNLLERHFDRFVMFFRVLVLVVAVVLFVFAAR